MLCKWGNPNPNCHLITAINTSKIAMSLPSSFDVLGASRELLDCSVSSAFSFCSLAFPFLCRRYSRSAIFSVVHIHHRQSGYDANDSIKHSAKVQAYFRLEKPVSFLLPRITRLEYDIYDEIGLPGTQVAILSMHESGESNWTDVVFGVLSKPMDSPINPVSLSVLRSPLIDLFNQRSNLTLTKSIFGLTSNFEILKFPGGITIIPKLSPPLWFLPEVLFNFTLRNSLHEIEDNFLVLKEQLKSRLQLMPSESVYVQVTNKVGSTRDPPVIVQASIMSDLRSLDPQRLKQLAEEITGSSPAKNLGLDNSVFGKVKEISLSSFLSHTLDAPTPSPAPSPEPNDHTGFTRSPASSPARSPASSPCPNSPDNRPKRSVPPVSNSPSPATESDDMSPGSSPGPDPGSSGQASPPSGSPLPSVSYGSVPSHENSLAPSPVSVLPSSSGKHSISYSMHIWWWLTVLVLL